MSADFRDVVLAMAKVRPNARASTIVDLALAIEAAPPGNFDDATPFGKWAATQPEVKRFLGAAHDDTSAKIHAIKELRALTHCSLLQAKNAIEAVIA